MHQHSHQLYFASLFHPGRALSFPCNRNGEVELDRLSERARDNYFLARSVVGCEYSAPTVIALEEDSDHRAHRIMHWARNVTSEAST